MKRYWLAILTALVAQMLLGFAWYSRVLFAEAWMAGIGKRPEDLVPGPGPFAFAVAAALLLPFGIAWIMHRTSLFGVKAGAIVGAGVGIAFLAPPVLVHEAFLGYPPMVLMIDASKEFVSGIVVGAIIGVFRRG